MKRSITISLFLASVFATCAGASEVMRAVIAITGSKPFEITRSENADVKIERKDIGRGERTYAVFSIPIEKDSWTKVSLGGVSKSDQELYITIQPEYSVYRRAAYFDDIAVNGENIKNGGFENGMEGWALYGDPNIYQAAAVPKAAAGKPFPNGKFCARISPTNPVQTKFSVEAGKNFDLTAMCRDAGALGECRNFFFLDIPETPADTDVALTDKFSFAPPPREIAGVKLAPAKKPLILSKSRSCSLKIPETSFGRFIYVLSSSNRGANSSAGTLVIRFPEGKSTTFPIVSGTFTGFVGEKSQTRFCRAVDCGGKFYYLTRFDIAEGSEYPVELEFKASPGSALSIAAATLSPVKIDPSPDFVPGPPEWLPADVGDAVVKEGTILDLSKTVKPNAGSKGRIIVNKRGKFAFEGEPEKSLRFHACMTTFPELAENNISDLDKAKKSIRKRIAELKRGGYNLMRVWGLGLPFNPTDKYGEKSRLAFDFMLEEFRRQGIYIDLMLPIPFPKNNKGYSIEGSHVLKTRLLFGDKELLDEWARVTLKILNHKNSISGIRIKDDPVILTLEYINEIGLGPQMVINRGGKDAESALVPWRKWLKEKFKDIGALNSAWKTSFKDFSEISEKYTLYKPEWRSFIIENGRRFHKFCEKTMRDAGYRGLVNEYNFSPEFAFSALRADGSDYVAKNTYFAHPFYERERVKGWSDNNGASMQQKSSLSETVQHFRRIAQTKMSDRPMIMTEYKHCFWNVHQYEDGLAFPAYAALQDFSAICTFIRSMESGKNPIGSFTTGNNPVAVANEIMAYCFFGRGDVSPAKGSVELVLTDNFLKNASGYHRSISGQQSRIPLLTGFSVSFPDIPKRDSLKGVSPSKPDIRINPEGYSSIKANDWFAETIEGADGNFKLKDFAALLKSKGIFDRGNATDTDREIYQSDTGQIKLDVKRKKMSVSTPKSQAVALTAGDSESLENIEVKSTTANAAVALCAMDGKKISESSSLILIYSTSALNSGMRLSEDMTYAKHIGKAPALIRTGRLSASLKLKPGAKFRIYPLSLTGERRAPLELIQTQSGSADIEIDLSKLPNGPTTLFEISEI